MDALYVTGGGSELPLVARVLREEFGRKVKRSEYTRSATAIGLAIQADAPPATPCAKCSRATSECGANPKRGSA